MNESKKKALLEKRMALQKKLKLEELEKDKADAAHRARTSYVENVRKTLANLCTETELVINETDFLPCEEGLDLVTEIMFRALHCGIQCRFARMREIEVIFRLLGVLLNEIGEDCVYCMPVLSGDSVVFRKSASEIATHSSALWANGSRDFVVTTADLESGITIEREWHPRKSAYYLECKSWGRLDISKMTVISLGLIERNL